MLQLTVALVAVASVFEAGVHETEGWMDTAIRNLEKQNLRVVAAKPVLTDRSNVGQTIERLRAERFELLVIMNGTWAADSLQVDIIREFSKPTLLWALPYPKTYSLASVQHLGSVLKELRIRFNYVYGAPDDIDSAKSIARFAKIAGLASLWNSMRVGKVGRRYTWRTMGPTDITYDELDLEPAPGPNPVHIDLDEFFALVGKIPDSQASELIGTLKKNGKLGKVEVKEKPLLEAAKAYFAAKELIKKYHLDALTIECYPKYAGLDNLASAWLAEEGIVSVDEGDLGHTALWRIMQELSGKPVGLIEPVKIDFENDTLILKHEGSGAPSLSEQISEVALKPVSEENGVLVFSSVKPGPVTMATVWGRRGKYKMNIVTGSALKLSKAEIEKNGGGLVAQVRFKIPAFVLVDRMIDLGVDHHLMLTPGDIAAQLVDFCKMTGIEPITPGVSSRR
jgi:L-fucose isomerase-like protein